MSLKMMSKGGLYMDQCSSACPHASFKSLFRPPVIGSKHQSELACLYFAATIFIWHSFLFCSH